MSLTFLPRCQHSLAVVSSYVWKLVSLRLENSANLLRYNSKTSVTFFPCYQSNRSAPGKRSWVTFQQSSRLPRALPAFWLEAEGGLTQTRWTVAKDMRREREKKNHHHSSQGAIGSHMCSSAVWNSPLKYLFPFSRRESAAIISDRTYGKRWIWDSRTVSVYLSQRKMYTKQL